MRNRVPFLAAILVLIVALGGALSYLAGWWGPAAALTSQGSITFTTENGEGSGEGTVDSPLLVRVRLPDAKDSTDSFPVSVNLELLDESGKLAQFGGKVEDKMPMHASFEMGVWEYSGSVPSNPGTYHVRAEIQLLSGDPQTPTSEAQTLDFNAPLLHANPETGSPLRTGYVFARESNLWMMSTDLSRQRRLTFFPAYFEYADSPTWSPDGKSIAFAYSPQVAQNDIPATSIWAINPDGSGLRSLVEHGQDESLYDPAWSPDGRYIYFTVESSAMDSTTYDASGAPVGQRHIDRFDMVSGIRSQWVPSAQMPVAAGPSGDLVCLEDTITQGANGGTVNQRMVRIGANGSPKTTLVDDRAFQLMYYPTISPDGKWIAFAAINVPPPPQSTNFDFMAWLLMRPEVAHAHGLPWDLYMVPASGGAPTQLTAISEDQPHPAWLDNSTIAFMGVRGLYKLQIDGAGKPVGQPTKIHEGAPHGGLTWHGP